ncbi:energy-coupling factor transporter transmembrane protein EcfT [Corynebacterium uropygiale]|uniref:Energy-coupling factor transporter transmembrane protein EcfT n=1 Tax=Corynebacterium uropygiale TaxID=1775911 RepID=A0A9X1QRD9_9CORY|nr:energy-coupling factor transporter transmembrane component T [Corynebacterium uropygiale]MCF4007751.1 energy-coupling factor transporter transmembrane protein EcfT [Corynebacterium uropygiale]
MTLPSPCFNPVGRFLAAGVLTTPLLLSIDRISAAVALVLSVPLMLYLGFGPRAWVRWGWPVLLAAALAGISMSLYGQPAGEEYFSFLTARVTSNSLRLGEAITLRVLAIGLPTIALLRSIDPTDLGDGLAQILRLPARFVLSAMAGVRLLGAFRRDWHTLGLARRARGLGDHGRIRRGASQAFALLIFALRRADTLSTAMEARGFRNAEQRTWARPSQLGRADALLILACLSIAVVALGVSVWSGEFRFLGVT